MNISTGQYITVTDLATDATEGTVTYRLINNWGTGITNTNDPYAYVDYNGDYKSADIRRHAFRLPKKKKGSLESMNSPDKRLRLLNPVLIFEFARSRFNTIQSIKLSKRMEMVCKIMESAKAAGQIALKENIEKEFGNILREQEMIACGFAQYISSTLLQKFIEADCKKNH